MLNAIAKTWPSGFLRSIMVKVRILFGVRFGGRRNQTPILRQIFYQSASLLDADIAPQNTPREKQLYGNPVQELIGFDSLLDAFISGSLGPLEQKQAIENEFQKPQNTFSVSEKLEKLSLGILGIHLTIWFEKIDNSEFSG